MEHNAVVRPLFNLNNYGISYTEAEIDLEDDDITLANFEKAITDKTEMIACIYASNVWGKILPIEAIGKLAKERGLLFLVDGAQAAGIVDIDIQKCNIDFLCVPGHKGLYGPMGTGMLIINKEIILDTIIEGGTGTNSNELVQPDYLPERLESGTINTPGIAGLTEGIKFIKRRGKEIADNDHKLILMMYDGLCEIKGIKLYTPRPVAGFVPLISFNIENMECNAVAESLDKMGICVRSGLQCASRAHNALGTLNTGTVRASLGAFNRASDVDKFLRCMRNI